MTDNGQSSPRPKVASLCGTYLKPEMQSIYRQVANLRRHENVVLTEQVQHMEQFPFSPVVEMNKLVRPRPRGNFLLRFWYKHVVKQWPPPRRITKLPDEPYFPYDLPRLLREHNPDILHVYYGHKAVKYLDMILEWGGPFVVSFHGVDVVKFLDQPGYKESLQRVFAEAQLVLARSRSLLAELEKLGCPREKLRLNRTPIPLESFPAKVRDAPSDGAWRLVQACRLIPKKGLFTTLKALAQILPEFPRLQFTVLGSGPVKDKFLAERDRVGLRDHVRVVGWVDQAALRQEYESAHCFLHPSELTETSDQEGIPNSMLEAMASGLPVVATLHGGIPEAVTNGHDGLLVAEKSPEELAAALRRLLGDPALLSTLSGNASASVRENFGMDQQISKLEDCYEEAVALFRKREVPV